MSEGEEKKVAEISVDRETCIGAVVCEALAGGTFLMDDENIAVVKPKDGWDDRETILDAARACPVLAIKVKDEDGTQLYPEEG